MDIMIRFTSIFRVIMMMHHPTSSELQLADSHLEIILKDILINLGIHFPLHNGKQSMSRDSKADPNPDALLLGRCFLFTP